MELVFQRLVYHLIVVTQRDLPVSHNQIDVFISINIPDMTSTSAFQIFWGQVGALLWSSSGQQVACTQSELNGSFLLRIGAGMHETLIQGFWISGSTHESEPMESQPLKDHTYFLLTCPNP